MKLDRAALLDRLAADHALGLLPPNAARRFEHVLREQPTARAASHAWERRLARLYDVLPPVAPSSDSWTAIATRTGAPPALFRPRSPARVFTWRGLVAASVGGALLVGLVVRMAPDAVISLDDFARHEQRLPQGHVGVLTDARGLPVAVAGAPRQGTRLTLNFITRVPTPPDKALQLWVVPRGRAPFALGALPSQTANDGGRVQLELGAPADSLFADQPRLAISVEAGPIHDGGKPAAFILEGPCVPLR
ncbi:MAG TPA: anti-sigma factor [Burkholderiaceae bacterium]|nr:anti-sigma factor [Burkholderiaceae bacterium]